jgi:hypothetical protein
VAPAQAEQVVL